MSRRKKKKGRPPKQAKALTAKHAPLASASSAAIMGMQRTDGDESDVEGSEWEPDEIPDKQPSCAICSTKSSKKWWKAPRSQNGLYLCEACGLSYRKYGVAIPYKPYLASLRRTSERRDSPPVEAPPPKRQKVSDGRTRAWQRIALIASCLFRLRLLVQRHPLLPHLRLRSPAFCALRQKRLRNL